MKFYEYQTKALLRPFGISTPNGVVVRSLNEVAAVTKTLKTFPVVVKAQVLTGGRGKAGGIQFAKNSQELEEVVKQLLGKELTTYQSAGTGERISTLYIEEKASFNRSLYLALTIDRTSKSIMVIASAEGGMEIEEVAAKHPQKIITQPIPLTGYTPSLGRTIAYRIGLSGELLSQFGNLLGQLVNCFIAKDATLIEINPLVITPDNKLLALDAKLSMDDNASFRQKELSKIYAQENAQADDALERQAGEIGVNYVALDGSIGCMVNGAGLAMATMDIVKFFGGEPANFLDVGGGVSSDQVRDAFNLLTSTKKVKGIFVNIFGGIVHCDKVATGMVAAARNLGLNLPVVVRLEGTNAEIGKTILRESGFNLFPVSTMEEGAKLIVDKVNRTVH